VRTVDPSSETNLWDTAAERTLPGKQRFARQIYPGRETITKPRTEPLTLMPNPTAEAQAWGKREQIKKHLGTKVTKINLQNLIKTLKGVKVPQFQGYMEGAID